MFVVYVLFSKKFNKIYIGFTSKLISRFKSHNEIGSGWTKKFRPWSVEYLEFFDSKKEAMLREKQLKSSRLNKTL
ncbi:MAG: endonuclease [Marinilabiliales bacterium]|nr:MAG: endonuclease [Marinilabiliales bacterium]